jgi:hypothetical protein
MGVIVILEVQCKPETLEELTATLENILPETRVFYG